MCVIIGFGCGVCILLGLQCLENNCKKIHIHTRCLLSIGPYSQGILFGSTLYRSGQVGIDPNTGELVQGGIEAETDQVLRNLGAILRAANMDYQDVVFATIFLKDLDGYSAMNQVYAGYFDVAPPARKSVEVARIPADANVEISVVAMK